MTAGTAVAERAATRDFFRPRRLGHVNLVVEDVDATMAFYRDVVGLHESYRQPLIDAGFLSNGNTHHDIGMVGRHGPLGKARPTGLNHLAFELETEVELVAGYERAVAAGVTFLRTVDHDVAHALYFADPDGNHCEIYADVVKDWRAVRSGIVTKPKPRWTPGSTPPTTERNYHVDPELRPVETAVFGARRITHVTLAVERYEDCVRYYRDLVGLVPVVTGKDDGFVILGGSLGEPNLGLFRAGPGRPPGLHHFGIVVGGADELDRSLGALRAGGTEPEAVVETPLRRSVFVKDPNGIRVQLYAGFEVPVAALEDGPADLALFTV